MFYALLTTISAIHPTATPIPVPTNFPISIAENLTDLPMWIEILGIAASVILGGAALFVSWNAYRFAKQQQKREEDMRKQEAKIAVIDKIFEIYHFFCKEVFEFDFNTEDKIKEVNFTMRINEIRFISKALFNNDTFNDIFKLLDIVADIKRINSMDDTEYMEYATKNGFWDSENTMRRHFTICIHCTFQIHTILKDQLNLDL